MLEQAIESNIPREEEFSFGDKVLVSPVVNPGQVSKKVYLPAGYWYHYWSDTVLKGGEEHDIATPLDEMPLFIKAGAVIPEYPVMQYVDLRQVDSLKLRVYYADIEVNSFLYEDHGDTFAYEQEIYLEKKNCTKRRKK